MRQEFGDIVYTLLNAAAHNKDVAASLSMATKQYKASLAAVVVRLQHIHALRRGLTEQDAEDILWFYFGYQSYFVLHNEMGWEYSRAEEWLSEAAERALLEGY